MPRKTCSARAASPAISAWLRAATARVRVLTRLIGKVASGRPISASVASCQSRQNISPIRNSTVRRSLATVVRLDDTAARSSCVS